MKRIIILGGGTFSPVRNHFSLCAPAFGATAKKLFQLFNGKAELYLTHMADPDCSYPDNKAQCNLRTNEDVKSLVDKLVADETVGTIIMNVAFCDFDPDIDDKGFHGERLQTANGSFDLRLKPAPKILDSIRKVRPDIFLVGFKTTTNKSNEEQFLTALKMMKRSKCNLVLANDTVTRHNMILTPEESKYEAGDRDAVLQDLVKIVLHRNNLTYSRTNFTTKENVSFHSAPESLKTVVQYLIDNGGFIENNGNGFTPGHFCFKMNENSFASSQRKVDHRNVVQNGLTKVMVADDGKFFAEGSHKPSVGARSQWLIMSEHKGYDCIIHTHNPLKSNSSIPVASQKEYQCGSLECGMNTLYNMKDFGDIKAVMLDKHGANILFKSTAPAKSIIDFIEENIELGVKTT